MNIRITFLLVLGLTLYYSCSKELSFESSSNPSVGTLQSNVSGDCFPKSVAGVFEKAKALVLDSNYILIEVNVTTIGSYTIFTDTVNGYYFKATGVFSVTGANVVKLKGTGTPGLVGINNFVVNYGVQICTVAVTVLPAGAGGPAVFSLAGSPATCTGAVPAGTYSVGVPMNSGNTVPLSVNVTTIGTYTISTTAINGITFSATGAFTTTGVQNVLLLGSGTPVTAGNTIIPVTAGTSTCSFNITVSTASVAVFTFAGSPVCSNPVIAGVYTLGVVVSSAHTVSLSVNVTIAGTYNINSTLAGNIQFGGSGTLATGPQTIILVASGTPNTAGANNFSVTMGSSTCTFNISVGTSAAAGTLSGGPGACAPIMVNGTYTMNSALTVSNTVQVQVNVTTPGAYNINTSTVSGFSFSASGNFTATGLQNVILNGTGTPSASGAISFIVNFGSSTCTFQVTVLSGGVSAFIANCSSATPDPDGLYEAGTQLNCSNTVTISVNVTATGPYNLTTTTTNGMTFTASGTFSTLGPQPIILLGSGTPVTAGTSNIPMPGTTPCTFPIIVDATPTIDWAFTKTNTPLTIYRGQTDQTVIIPNGIGVILGLAGSNSLGVDAFEFALSDVNGTIANGETYSTSVPQTSNAAIFSYTLPSNCTADTYLADITTIGVSITFIVTTHNTTTKTITGTFSGTAKNMAGQTITIASGTFRGTYP